MELRMLPPAHQRQTGTGTNTGHFRGWGLRFKEGKGGFSQITPLRRGLWTLGVQGGMMRKLATDILCRLAAWV